MERLVAAHDSGLEELEGAAMEYVLANYEAIKVGVRGGGTFGCFPSRRRGEREANRVIW